LLVVVSSPHPQISDWEERATEDCL
jgi:hypothetical protein